MKTTIAATLIALSLAGCSSSVVKPDNDPIVAQLQNQSVDYVQQKLGLPNRRENTPSGAMVWTYFDKKHGIAANDCSVTLSIRDNKVEHVLVDTHRPSLLSLMASSCDDIRKSLASNN